MAVAKIAISLDEDILIELDRLVRRHMTIRRLKTQYEIGADGRTATAMCTFEQTARLKDTDRVIVSVGEERCVINLIDGIPKATSIDVTMEFR